MPLTFYAIENFDDGNKYVYFDLDLKFWGFQDIKVKGKLPKKLNTLNNKLKKEKYNVLEVAVSAIKSASQAGFIHNDLEFRHISLCPIFDDNKIKFKPILIDFENMIENNDPKYCEQVMLERLNEISEGCIFK